MKRSLIFALASCFALSFTAVTPASAGTDSHAAQRVSYADLNLNEEAGSRALLGRLNHAASHVCGAHNTRTTLAETQAINRCVRNSVDDAVRAIGNPTLAALNDGRRAWQFASR